MSHPAFRAVVVLAALAASSAARANTSLTLEGFGGWQHLELHNPAQQIANAGSSCRDPARDRRRTTARGVPPRTPRLAGAGGKSKLRIASDNAHPDPPVPLSNLRLLASGRTGGSSTRMLTPSKSMVREP